MLCCNCYYLSWPKTRFSDDRTFVDRIYYDPEVPCVISCRPDLTSCDLVCGDGTTTVAPTTVVTTTTTQTTGVTTTAKPARWNNLTDVLKQFWQKYKARAGIAALSVTGMEIVTCQGLWKLCNFQMSGGYVTYKYVIPVFVEWIQDLMDLLRPEPTTTTPFTSTSTTGRCFKLVLYTQIRARQHFNFCWTSFLL